LGNVIAHVSASVLTLLHPILSVFNAIRSIRAITNPGPVTRSRSFANAGPLTRTRALTNAGPVTGTRTLSR
jgi:hypothetical protein